ncbi:FAD-dependent oxidoreductase [Methylobacterium sp. WL19]|uniref:FAD-dependent oxidoreductase n=1 Tax=Methylobacterium sp. WL19 TaxID=2603896 RepID=UPI0011CB65BC|nr:FAD-dependent oxidoreductase [Methylobacterium sp. WL19]TXN33879.1 FAD-dependent oxidoreductase [Methylobacterium sp. WL19]
MATKVVDFFCYGATLPGYAFMHYACRGGGTGLIAEWTGHKGGLTTGGLGVGDWDTPRWGKVKEFNVWIGRERMGRTDGSEVKDITSMSAQLALDAVFIAGNANIEVRVNCRLKNVFKNQITKAVYMVEFENGDFVMMKYCHDASYEVDLARMAGVKMRQGRESATHWNEPVEFPDKEGRLSTPGLNKTFGPQGYSLYDTRGDRVWTSSQPPQKHLLTGDAVPVCQANGWRFEFQFNRNGEDIGVPFSKPPGWSAADTRKIIDLRSYTRVPGSPDPVSAGGVVFPFGNSARGLENNPLSPETGKVGTNGCDLPGHWTNGWMDMTYDQRVETAEHAAWITMGSHWVVQTDPSISSSTRDAIARFRLVTDVWQTPGDYTLFPGWPPAFYIRDAGGIWAQFNMDARMAYNNPDSPDGKWNFDDSVTTGGYPLDIHTPIHFNRPDGYGQKEGYVDYTKSPNYGVPIRAMLPDFSQCSNLTVSWGAGGSAIWRSSWRMEQTVARGAQACGMLMDLANRGRNGVSIPISQVPFADLRAMLNAENAVTTV